MVCQALEPGAAGWQAQTNPLSYCATPHPTLHSFSFLTEKSFSVAEDRTRDSSFEANLRLFGKGALQQKEMKKLIGPKVKQVRNVAMHAQHNFWRGCHKNNSLTLGPIQPSSPSTKELHDSALRPPFRTEQSTLHKMMNG